MEVGKKIYQLRKLSGMTQEQLAEKLNISRQTLSKWENGTSMPDVESVVGLSMLFQTSLDELLLEGNDHAGEKKTQITLEDMMRINARNRKMNLLLSSGLLFLAIGIIVAAFERMLEITMWSLGYTLYRYMAVGQYEPLYVDYSMMFIPAVLAGIVGVVLCLCYFMKNREKGSAGREQMKVKMEKEMEQQIDKRVEQQTKKRVKKRYIIGPGALMLAAGVLLLVNSGKGEDRNNSSLYGDINAGLGDEEQFSLADIGEKNDVLFTTDMTYDDGNGHNAAVYCEAYYSSDGKLYELGRIESMGTAYPVSCGERCIYTASEHSLEIYKFDRKGKRWVASRYEEVFDEEGNASYRYTEDGAVKDVSETDYQRAIDEYGESIVVNFGYGASDNPNLNG